jgi:hypothetical protein
MRVEVNPADQARWTGYMRGSVLEQFDGRVWRRATRTVDRVYPSGLNEFRLRAPGEGPWLRQSIYLESMDTPVLFAAPHAFVVRIERPFLEVVADGTVQRRQSDAWRIHYEVVSAPTAGSEPFLTTRVLEGRRLPDEETAYASQLPVERYDRVADLARSVGGDGPPAVVAERLAAYLRTNYTYSLDPGPIDDSTPVERFLFTNKKGHCEYFASSMALMLRYRGIPARIVTGFLSREWNERGHYYVVRMRHAHAWVEYFVPHRGWTEIDPSPRAVDEGDAASSWRRQTREAWDFLNLRWNRYILSYDLERQVAIIRSVSLKSGRISAGLEGAVAMIRNLVDVDGLSLRPTSLSAGAVRLPVGSVLVLLLVAAAVAAWRWRRTSASPVWFYPALVRLLQRAGARRAPDRTLRDMLGDAAPRLGAALPSAGRLTDAYYRLRFSPDASVSASERRAIQQALAEVRRGLATVAEKH